VARHLRSLFATTAAATALLAAGTGAGALPALPPGVSLPPLPTISVPPVTTSTTVAPRPAPTPTVPATTVPPSTAPPAQPGPPTTAPQTTPTVVPPAAATATVPPGPAPGSTAPTSTTKPPDAPDVARLSNGQVDLLLRTMARSGASSTAALVQALKPLQALGMTASEALALGMGRFPVQGVANWTDDWLDFRAGPPVHQHMGNDLFSAFDTPVRAPADGTVRFANEGLGGLAAYVTTADGTYYYFAHLKGFAPDLVSGGAVKQGRVIGFNGDSGNAIGGAPHVHFEIHPGGGAAVNPKPIIDGWVADAIARVPELIASLQPQSQAGAATDGGGVPQILIATGLTRRFSVPPHPGSAGAATDDVNRAVLAPLSPSAPVLPVNQVPVPPPPIAD